MRTTRSNTNSDPRRASARLVVGVLAAVVLTCGGTVRPAAAALTGTTRNVGSKPLGAVVYSIPTGAYFVATNGSDSASGSQSSPFRTIARAIAVAPNGGTIVIRGGIYRESLTIANERLTLQPYPNEAVTIRGSKAITGWTLTGGDWRHDGWGYQFARQGAAMLTATRPLADAPDMVFFDGQPMRQVSRLAQVAGKTFHVDYATAQMTIGADPTGHVVEGSYLSTALTLLNADNSVIRGLQFDRFATPVNPHGAVIDQSDGVTFDNDIFIDNATDGLSLRGSGTTVQNSTFSDNGQLGLHAYLASNLHILNNKIHHNNVEGFDTLLEAGGAKLVSTTGVRFEGNYVDANLGNGIWFDIDASGTEIVRNDVFSNKRNGIQFEISGAGIIAGNAVRNNTAIGIHVLESYDVDVFNNVSYKNDVALTVWEGNRPEAVSDVVVQNNVFMDGRSTTRRLVDVDDKTNQLSGTEMGVSTNYNAYCRSAAGTPARVADWVNTVGVSELQSTVTAFANNTGNERSGYSCEGAVSTGFFVKPSGGNFGLTSTSLGHSTGAPLPVNVASALGVPAGVAVDLGTI